MPIKVGIERAPGTPSQLAVTLAAADSRTKPVRHFDFQSERQIVLPVVEGRDPKEIARMLARIRARSPSPGDVTGVGQYLFAVLFGDHDWREAAASEPGSGAIELTLEIADDAALRPLHNLPWESLHDDTSFLA